MSFPRSARSALKVFPWAKWPVGIVVVILAALAASCGHTNHPALSTHNAYITLPAAGSVRLLRLNDSTGAIIADAQTPPVGGLSPTGIALHPSKKFLYTTNGGGNSVSVFNIASDGTLTVSGSPTPAGSAPSHALIDPSGQYLLVSNTQSGTISVYSMDSGTGALTEVAGSPFDANLEPTGMAMTPSGNFLYVTNPSGFVTALSFSAGTLAKIASPFPADLGAGPIAIDATGTFLYTANTTANDVSGFRIGADGTLSKLQGSPYISAAGSQPSAIAIDPGNTIVYVTTPGTSFSIWAFKIDQTSGVLTAAVGSPFNLLAGGGLFVQMEPRGSYFYVASPSNSSIAGYQYNSGGTPQAITNSPFSTGSTPGQMVIVP